MTTWSKQPSLYLSGEPIPLSAGVLCKSSHLGLISQSMLFLPRLASTCTLRSTGKSQCGLFGGTNPSPSVQEKPVPLYGAWNSRTKTAPLEKLWVLSWDGGEAWCLEQTEAWTRDLGLLLKKRPPSSSPSMAAHYCGVGANDTKF